MAADLVGFGKGITFTNYNDRFHQYRKLFSRFFGTRNSTAAFNSIEEEETRRFLRNVLRQPEGLVKYIRSSLSSPFTTSTAGAIILKVAYGYPVQEENDPFVDLANKVMGIFSLVTAPSAYLVDLIPARKAKRKHPSL
ncbi:hypothetical protein J3R82DRAFT_10970 [Butyriboletus roseoflavus]|nr:hypothetical protein J3R82DRAFT_10970 [Butyriboletus roseoflavus]